MVSFLTALAGKLLPVASIRADEDDFYTIKYKNYEDQHQDLIQYLVCFVCLHTVFIRIEAVPRSVAALEW